MAAIIILTGITTFAVIIVAYQYATRQQQSEHAEAAGAITPRWLELVRYFSRYASAFPKIRYFDGKMLQAGIMLKGSEFVVLSIGFAAVSSLAGLIFTNGSVAVGVGAGLSACLISLIYINIKIARRLKAINAQLPDVLVLMANALRAGLSLFQAIEMVAREMTPPLSQEFSRLLKEISLGFTTEDALVNMTKRVKHADLELVVTAVLIQRQVGGNLAVILDNVAATIRERIMIKNELRALTAHGRLSGWVVGLLPIVLMVVIIGINPEYVEVLFKDQLGRIILAGAVVSQLLGAILIRRIININM